MEWPSTAGDVFNVVGSFSAAFKDQTVYSILGLKLALIIITMIIIIINNNKTSIYIAPIAIRFRGAYINLAFSVTNCF